MVRPPTAPPFARQDLSAAPRSILRRSCRPDDGEEEDNRLHIERLQVMIPPRLLNLAVIQSFMSFLRSPVYIKSLKIGTDSFTFNNCKNFHSLSV